MSGAAGPGPGPPAGQGRSPLPCAPRPAAALQLAGGAEPARPGVAVIDLRFPRGAAADVSSGDRLQELLHGLPERAGAAPRPQRLPPVGDLPAGLLPDALPAHRGGLPGLLLPPPPPDAVRRGPGDSSAVHPAAAVPGLAPLHHRGAADFPSRTEEPPEGFPLLALPVDSSGAASQPTRGAP